MKKYLKKQLLKKLRNIKVKNCNMFFHKVILNSSLKNLKLLCEKRKFKLNILYYSSLRKKLKKKVYFTQIVTQCNETWRTRSIYSFFRLSRITLREFASFGFVKGLRKSSW